MREVSGSEFGAASTLSAIADFGRYPEYATFWTSSVLAEFGFVAMSLAVLGALTLARRNRGTLAIVMLGGFASVPFAVAYRGVEADIDRYFMPSFVMCAIAIAVAPLVLKSIVPEDRAFARAILLAAQAFALATIVQANWFGAVHERDDTGRRATIDAVRRDTPNGAVVVALWVDGTSLAYAKYVEKSLGDRYVVAGWPGALTDSYARLSTFGPVYVYVYVPTNFAENLLIAVPNHWITRLVSSEPGHALFALCRTRRGCD